MYPSSALETQRPDLAGCLMEYDLQAEQAGQLALKIFPVLEVAKQAGNFGRIPIEELLKEVDTSRAPASGYARSTAKFEDDSYSCVEAGAESPVDDREAQMYAEYFNAEELAAQRARALVLRSQEVKAKDLVFPSGMSTTAVSNAWSVYASATPIADVRAACWRMFAATGLWPNGIVMSRKSAQDVKLCDEVLDKVKYVFSTLPKDITTEHIAAAFELPYIFVGGGIRNSADEGRTMSIATIWPDEYVAVGRFAPPGNSDIQEPCFGRCFHWGADGSRIGTLIESYRDSSIRADVIRARMDIHMKVLYAEAIDRLSGIHS